MTDTHHMEHVAEEAHEEAQTEGAEEEAKDRPAPLLDMARRVLLASIGAVALAADEIEDFVDRLVERGEIAEKDGRKLVKDVLERRRAMGPLDEKLDEQIERVVNRLNIPTKSDVQDLSSRMAELSQKIDELEKK